jgi:hypothetical protein
MKGTFAKLIQRSLVAMLLVFGALALSTSRAEAQVTNINLNWVTESEAITALDGAVVALAVDMGNYTQGSTPWVALANQVEYYKLVMGAIENGTSVPVAVLNTTINGYNANPAGTDSNATTITPAQMDQIRANAVDLLTI